MYGLLGRLTRPLASRSTWRRWAHLIMGGALVMPYMVLGALLADWLGQPPLHAYTSATVFALSLPVAAATALLIPDIRMVEVAAAAELLGGRAAGLLTGDARSWPQRWRTAAWFAVHLLLGGLVSALTLSMPPLGAVLLVAPFVDVGPLVPAAWTAPWAPLAGLGVFVALIYLVAGVGAALARLAPVLLGSSPSERLAELERRAGQLAERNRLARELHDSVGHALTTATLQAGAASRLLDADPEFVRQALAAIEDTGRAALEDLDHVLGLLRSDSHDGSGDRAPQRTLADLDDLLTSTRSTGVTIDAELIGDVGRLSPAVSREAYRIVQEALTNALRHAGKVPVSVRLAVGTDRLELEMSNPIDATAARKRHVDGTRATANGGRGLQGMRERVAILRGQMSAAAEGEQWHVAVRLPLGKTP